MVFEKNGFERGEFSRRSSGNFPAISYVRCTPLSFIIEQVPRQSAHFLVIRTNFKRCLHNMIKIVRFLLFEHCGSCGICKPLQYRCSTFDWFIRHQSKESLRRFVESRADPQKKMLNRKGKEETPVSSSSLRNRLMIRANVAGLMYEGSFAIWKEVFMLSEGRKMRNQMDQDGRRFGADLYGDGERSC